MDPGQTKIYTRSSDIFNPDLNAHAVSRATSGATNTKACQFEVTQWRPWSLGPIESGGYTIEAWWNNANPLNLAYVPRLTLSTTHAAACGLEVIRTWYVQRINGDGSAEREFRFHVNNTGEADCSSSAVHLASIAA